MTKYGNFLFFLLLMLSGLCWAQQTKKAEYEAGTVIFKLKSVPTSTYNNRYATSAMPDEVAEKLKKKVGGVKVAQPFPSAKNAKNHKNVQRQVSSALDGIFKMQLPAGISVEEVVEILRQDPEVQYAEPYYLPQLLEVPNDPNYTHQSQLQIVKAAQAWDIQKGNKDIVIAIIDTGVDYNHPDLVDNLYLNEKDPIDGIDNDGDGYTDNYHGWDFANYDNNPMADGSSHGTVVAGACAATTNNGIGVAGSGYNSRFMPIKVFTTKDSRFVNGYEAIVYAANMGCKIINLSWGGDSPPSEYVQDIIRYAVLEKDAVVVAAAGNTNANLNFYPASYNYVLSVSGSDNLDNKDKDATWSRYVDLVSPMINHSTVNGKGYVTTVGTSFASPTVAGAAALVRAKYPELTALQVIERLRRTTDDIYANGKNAAYVERLGTGRLNMFAALQAAVGPSVRMDKFEYNNGFGNYAFHKDTVRFVMDFTNYLDPTTNVEVKLISESPYATVLEGDFALGAINTRETVSNTEKPFRVYLHPDLPALTFLTFKLEFTNNQGYKDYQYFQFRSSGLYIDFKVDDLTLTVASNGNLGYNYDYNLQGLGLRYQNAPLAHNMGLILAQNPKAVANNAIFYTNPAVRDQDFRTKDRLRLYKNSPASVDARSSFEVIVKDSTKLNLLVDQRILGWSDPSSDASVVIEYRIINRADTVYKNLNVALFADFNLGDFSLNRAEFSTDHKLGYTYDAATGRYAGVALLSGQPLLYHAVDLNTRNGNTAEIKESLSRLQKWNFISKGISKEEAGIHGSGNDVAKFLGGTITELAPKTAEKVVFAMVTSSSLAGLEAAVQKAKQQYLTYKKTPPLIARVQTCTGVQTQITPKEGNIFRYFSDEEARKPIAEGESITFEPLSKDTTIYAVNINDVWASDIERIEVLVSKPEANFSMSTDTLYLNNGDTESIIFTDISPKANEWQWDFGNGILGNEASATVPYTTEGTYLVEMEIKTEAGCTNTIQQKVVVIRKENLPSLQQVQICINESAVLADVDGRLINVYDDAQKQHLLYSGTEFTTPALPASRQYYISAGRGVKESKAVPFLVEVFNAKLHLSHQQLTDSDSQYAVRVTAQLEANTTPTHIQWYEEKTLIGEGEHLTYAYDANTTAPTLQVVVAFSNGCSQQFLQQLPLVASAKPSLLNVVTCKGEVAVLEPQQEGVYYFYADDQKKTLLHRGPSYTVTALTTSQTFYVTSLNGGLESEVVSVLVNAPEDFAAFEVAETQQTLTAQSPVKFANTSQHLTIRWEWNFGDGNTSSRQNPEHSYQAPGSYTVSLTATNIFGCTETKEQVVVIEAPNGLSGSIDRLQVYPNPTNGEVNLQMPENLQQNASITVLSASGKQLTQQPVSANTTQISLEAYPKGMYLIRLVNGRQVWQSRVVLQ
ncbi:S8 family serine peptidase [Cesiribacter sp. SM1]|uniref:S8 family serine peptidase n=1 Tax=Cesiribacter sp. SM1 TaxID=2861196 RepID=UPI002714C177|nr:S8 family serine peptidase [Cesiribacter sp. SM1]